MGDKTSKPKGKPKGKPAAIKQPAEQPAEQPEPVGNADADAAADAAYYCPGCGQRYADGPSLCTGTPTAPHPEIETVSTDELELGPEHHTPAPSSE